MSDKHLLQSTILFFCLRFFYALVIDLSPQEAYYWNYAKHPALSYYGHPLVVDGGVMATANFPREQFQK